MCLSSLLPQDIHPNLPTSTSRQTKLGMDLTTTDLRSIVIIILEATGTQISIHKDILCAHCKFAEACLTGEFKEARAGQIILREEDDEQSVRTLISWMYSGRPIFPIIPSTKSSNFRDHVKDLLIKMIRLYIMVIRYVMIGFQKEIMTFISRVCQIRGPTSTSLYVMALQLLCDMYPVDNELKDALLSYLVPKIRKQLLSKEKSYFITSPRSEWCQNFFRLTARHPELANSILCGLLQPQELSRSEQQSVEHDGMEDLEHKCKRRRTN